MRSVARGFPALDRRVREGRWQRQIRPRVRRPTLGIVGFAPPPAGLDRPGKKLQQLFSSSGSPKLKLGVENTECRPTLASYLSRETLYPQVSLRPNPSLALQDFCTHSEGKDLVNLQASAP